MNRKSQSCIGISSGKPVTEYDSEIEAQEAADYINHKDDKNFTPYKCKKCELWHLTPSDRQTPSEKCTHCMSYDGKYKDLYISEEAARRRADIIEEEERIKLSVYECPHNDGWHLTKG